MNQRIIRSVAAFLLVATAIAAGSFAVRNGGKNEETFSVSGELAAETLVLRQGSRGATVRQIQQKLITESVDFVLLFRIRDFYMKIKWDLYLNRSINRRKNNQHKTLF